MKKKIIGIVLILVVIGIGLVLGMNSFKDKKEEVSAHPTNTIKLDEGGANEFEIPIDAQQLEEQAIENLTPDYDDYVQGQEKVPIINKEYVRANGVEQINGVNVPGVVRSIERTQFGHFFVLYGFPGNGRGGIVKVSVFDSDGNELATNFTGEMSNIQFRVNTILYDANNNSFLVGVHNGSFFRFTVSNESVNTATITRTRITATSNPIGTMRCDTTYVVDRFSDFANNVLIVGRINVGSTTINGIVPGRIPFGELNVDGWTNSAVLNGNVSNTFSVQNLTNQEVGISSEGRFNYCPPTSVYQHPDRNNIVFGTFYNEHKNNITEVIESSVNSFQMFDTSQDVLEGGHTIKRRVYEDFGARDYSVVKGICADDRVYYLAYRDNRTELIEIELTGFQGRVIKTYPPNTRLNLIDNEDGTISYYGSTTSLTGEFSSNYYQNQDGISNYFISGIMEMPANGLDVVSLRAFSLSGIVDASHVLAIQGTNRLFVGGFTHDTSPNFADDLDVYDNDGNNVLGATPSNRSAFTGILRIRDDYAPVIKQGNSITVDLTDSHISSPTDANYRGWNTLDRWLITGSKNGIVSDNDAIKVYDHIDSNDDRIAGTAAGRAEMLQRRINRNPRDIAAAIEWEALGFDATVTGPQLVTYFVTDSQSQPGVTSRWVNKKTGETVVDEDDKYALDAQNFHIPLTGIDKAISDTNKFKELAKTMAWSLTKHESTDGDQGNGLDEDGTDSRKRSPKVTVNVDQLNALKAATVAKPYPVDVTYEPENGIEIRNRVWVFVTTKNTVPNSKTNPEVTPADTNGVVYYADDYSLPFRLRGDHNTADVLDRGNIRVYDYYDSTHEKSTELPVLADKTTNSAKLQVVNLNAIKSATQPGLIDSSPPDGAPMIRYEWDGTVDGYHQAGTTKPTLGGLDVTLTGDILLHVRQVIVGDPDQLVVPEEGYLRMATNDYDGVSGTTIENADQLRQVRISSGKNADNPAFETIAVNSDHMDDPLDELELKLIIPEYYEIVGNYLTLGNADPNGASHTGKTEANSNKASLIFKRDELYNDEEYFITIYLKPKLNQDGPQPYSWDYKKNDLGKIKTK